MDTSPNYLDFFAQAFGRGKPFDYQNRLAEEFLPDLLNVPTGAGKTAAVLGAWLWRRIHKPETVGRRLIYCLPMRTLVEQTREVAKDALQNLEKAGIIKPNRFSVHTLYGGDVSDDWDVYPEGETILIGTQDLLLSRALNRGYAMNRFRWAFHFGLFNNDCLWVFDEVQLFGDGLATTAQLAAFRRKFKTFGAAHSLWMSATLDKDWLKTVDFADRIKDLQSLELSEKDRANTELKKRLYAVKNLQQADSSCRLPAGLAHFVWHKHEPGTQTLIVVNTVARAQEVFAELNKLTDAAKKQSARSAEPTLFAGQPDAPEIELLHSRFRQHERQKWQAILKPKDDKQTVNRIIVATQVIEAGVDISAKLLVTDIAPFPSLVQRFGRVNRFGNDEQAEIFWVDLPLKSKDEKFAREDFDRLDEKKLADFGKPYELKSLRKARAILQTLDSAAPVDLEKVNHKENYTANHVLRGRDLIDLFDTTADLSGFDLDVSRFVRGGEERDVSVFWREAVEKTLKYTKGTKKEKKDLAKHFAPRREELCSVPIYDLKAFLAKKKAWTFDALAGEWRIIREENLRTGLIILLETETGGYEAKIGWNPKSKRVEPVPRQKDRETESNAEAVDDDDQTFATKAKDKFISYTQTLTAHSLEVRDAAARILDKLDLPDLAEFREQIVFAAHHHDLGKAHPVFQATVQKLSKDVPLKDLIFGELLAKAKGGGKHRRSKFRHELASALALLEMKRSPLEIYLTAAHHGKVRLSIRALPDEDKPKDDAGNPQPDRKFARGIWDDEQLPAIDLGDGTIFPETILNLSAMQLGGANNKPSWLEQMLELRDDLGVFRLAYLEALVRAADVQASADPQDYFEKGNQTDAE